MFSLSHELKFGSPGRYLLADLDRGVQIRKDTGTFLKVLKHTCQRFVTEEPEFYRKYHAC